MVKWFLGFVFKSQAKNSWNRCFQLRLSKSWFWFKIYWHQIQTHRPTGCLGRSKNQIRSSGWVECQSKLLFGRKLAEICRTMNRRCYFRFLNSLLLNQLGWYLKTRGSPGLTGCLTALGRNLSPARKEEAEWFFILWGMPWKATSFLWSFSAHRPCQRTFCWARPGQHQLSVCLGTLGPIRLPIQIVFYW